MDMQQAIDHALAGQAVLFCGAGFSVGAQNLKGQNLKTGKGLAAYLAEQVGLPADTPLEDAAETFIEQRTDYELIRELIEQFKVKAISEAHKVIAEVPWMRIYTTNYDNVLETAFSSVGRKLFSVTLEDDIQGVPKQDALCVHLNGYIERLARKKLLSEFKLTDSAFASASIAESPWAALFRGDIQRARAVLFLGYSLHDLDIKRILFDSPQVREKCIFILGHKPDGTTLRRAQRFGTPLQIPVDEFAVTVQLQKSKYQPLEVPSLLGDCVLAFAPPTTGARLTDEAVFELLMMGDVSRELVFQSLHERPKYYLERDAAHRVIELINKGHQFVVLHGELGNGKSMLLEGLKIRLHEAGFKVFTLLRHEEHVFSELQEALQSIASDRTVFFVDNYPEWFDEIRYLVLNATTNVFYVMTARTWLHEVRYEKLLDVISSEETTQLSIDYLSSRDIEWIVDYLDDYGLWGVGAGWSRGKKLDFVRRDCDAQVHAVLLHLLQSPQIMEKFSGVFGDLSSQRPFFKVIVSILILSVLQEPYQVSVDMLVDLWSSVVLGSKFKEDSGVKQIIDFQRGMIKLRSSVAAQYILKNLIDAHVIVDTLIQMSNAAHVYFDVSPAYRQLRVSLMRFRNIQHIMPERQRRPETIRYYESVKNLSRNRDFPLFWLQYAIACLALEEYDRAKKYFDTAYSLAERSGFDTYQIDNHYARYLLLEVTARRDYSRAMDSFRQAHIIIGRQCVRYTQERPHYPYRVAAFYANFYDAFELIFTTDELTEVTRAIEFILQRIPLLTPVRQHNPYIEKCKKELEQIFVRARAKLKSTLTGVEGSRDSASSA